MPVFEITSPDGRTFEVQAPEGATKEQALAYVQSQLSQTQQPKRQHGSNILDALDTIDRKQAAAVTQEAQTPRDGLGYVTQQAKKGFASSLGMPVDAITNALNLGIAGYGVLKNKLTGSTDLPALIQDPVGGSKTFERLFLTNENIQPEGPISATTGRFVRDLASASIPVAGLAGRPAAFLPSGATPVQRLAAQTQAPGGPLAIGTGLTALASAGGETARSIVPEPYKDAADMAGMLTAGVALPALVASRLDAVNQLRDTTKKNNVNRVADEYVSRQIESDVRNFPKGAQNLDDALAMQEQVPGLQYRVGQASGVPSLTDMERRVATAGGEQFNRRTIQDQQQRQAILRQAAKDLPLLTGRNDITTRLEQTRTQRAGLENKLPDVDIQETGQLLRSARSSMKGRYDQIAAEKFNAPVAEANRLGVAIDPSRIVQKVEQAFSNPLTQFDPTNAPEVSRRILALSKKPDTPALVGPKGEPLTSPTQRIGFDQLKGLREAVNQDIAREAGSANPNARQRLRTLVEIKSEIDSAAQQAPESVRKLYNDAVSWYRDVYAPKFLRGINLKQTMRDITGEQRIADEKLAGQYFKKMTSAPMDRFLTLYGENPQAMTAMKNYVLDSYRREVVRNGFIDPKRHEIFIRNYQPSLTKLPDVNDGLKNLGYAARMLGEQETQLARAQNLLSKGQLDALKPDNPDIPGLDLRKLESFIKNDGPGFQESVSMVYGPKVAEEHMVNLRRIAKASEIAERGRLPEAAHPRQGLEPFDFQGKVGFTPRTLFNMIRAVTTGRTSAEDVMFTLGAQAGTHRVTQALIAAEERAISDPQTARLIAEAMKRPANSEAAKITLGQILEKGGLFILGGNKWPEIGRHRLGPTAVEATRMSTESMESMER